MTSTFFNNYNNKAEQSLYEDLIVESIKIWGHDVYYIPRTIVKKDKMYLEDTISEYNNFYTVDMYLKSVDGFEGDGIFMSKFGFEIRDQITMSVAIRTFNKEVAQYENIERAREGDLLYIPNIDKLFAIKYVNNRGLFYQLGQLQVYDLVCEMFEYSSERFNTGIEQVDSIQARYSNDMTNKSVIDNTENILTDEEGFPIIQDPFNLQEQPDSIISDDDYFKEISNTVIEWSSSNPFGMPE